VNARFAPINKGFNLHALQLAEGMNVRFKRPVLSVNVPPVSIKRGATGAVLAIGPAWDLPLSNAYVAIALDGVGEVTLPLQTCQAILVAA
jgi:hypothetical protein